jgi:hypothetical protein
VGETSLTGGDLDRIKTGKLTLSGYLSAGYAAARVESSQAVILSAAGIACSPVKKLDARYVLASNPSTLHSRVIWYC